MSKFTRKARVALIDPIDEVGYSRPARRGGKYTEDGELQNALDSKGVEGARQFASRRYQGVVVAVYTGMMTLACLVPAFFMTVQGG